MNQSERRIYLIKRLLEERSDCSGVQIPSGSEAQRRLLRSLMNVRMPGAIDADTGRISGAGEFRERNSGLGRYRGDPERHICVARRYNKACSLGHSKCSK